MERKRNVLFLCTHNSSRSQMAEAFLRKYAGDRFNAYSAGLDPTEIHPMTHQVMREVGLDLEGQYAKGVQTYLGKLWVSHLIVVCETANRRCPHVWPGLEIQERLFWPFDDPVEAEGSEEERLRKFRQVRDQIEERIKSWLKDISEQEDEPNPERQGQRKILFLCTHNSCRSQMAEGWARHLLKDEFESYSAGIAPTRVDPYAIQVMAEAGVGISSHHAKSINDIQDIDFDYVVTVCDEAREQCPYFPARVGAIHAGFDDPPALAGQAKNEQEALAIYRRVRDEIRRFIEELPRVLETEVSRSPK
jgi:arsenate reductase